MADGYTEWPMGTARPLWRACVWITVATLCLGPLSCTAVRKWEVAADAVKEAADAAKEAADEARRQLKEVADAIAEQGVSVTPRPLGSVQGRVTDESGEPLPDVSVSLGEDTVQTTAAGTYMVRNLLRGEYAKTIRKEGFVVAQVDVKVKGKEQTRNDARLVPEGTSRSAGVEGTVGSTSGAPIAGAWIQVLGYPERVRTGAKGRYRISDIHPGTRTLVIDAEGFAPQFHNLDLGNGTNLLDLSLMTHGEEWDAAVKDCVVRLRRTAEILEGASTEEGFEPTEDLDLAMLQLRAVLEDLWFLREDAGRANR